MHFTYHLHIMALTNVQIRLETDLKNKAEKVFSDVGLDMPTAVRVFLQKVVATRSIPFLLSTAETIPYVFSAKEESEILQAAQEAGEPGKLSGPFKNANDLIAHLRRQKA